MEPLEPQIESQEAPENLIKKTFRKFSQTSNLSKISLATLLLAVVSLPIVIGAVTNVNDTKTLSNFAAQPSTSSAQLQTSVQKSTTSATTTQQSTSLTGLIAATPIETDNFSLDYDSGSNQFIVTSDSGNPVSRASISSYLNANGYANIDVSKFTYQTFDENSASDISPVNSTGQNTAQSSAQNAINGPAPIQKMRAWLLGKLSDFRTNHGLSAYNMADKKMSYCAWQNSNKWMTKQKKDLSKFSLSQNPAPYNNPYPGGPYDGFYNPWPPQVDPCNVKPWSDSRTLERVQVHSPTDMWMNDSQNPNTRGLINRAWDWMMSNPLTLERLKTAKYTKVGIGITANPKARYTQYVDQYVPEIWVSVYVFAP